MIQTLSEMTNIPAKDIQKLLDIALLHDMYEAKQAGASGFVFEELLYGAVHVNWGEGLHFAFEPSDTLLDEFNALTEDPLTTAAEKSLKETIDKYYKELV